MPQNLERIQRRSPKSVTYGCVLLAVLLSSITAYHIRDLEPRLLARSRALPVTIGSQGDYYWLSSQEILVLKPAKTGFTASAIDTVNNMPSSDADLSRQLIGSNSYFKPLLSPNGKWLLVQQRIGGRYLGAAFSVPSGRKVVWQQFAPIGMAGQFQPLPPIWLSDSSHWLDFTNMDDRGWVNLLRHGVDEPDKDLGRCELFGAVVGEDRSGRLILYRMEAAAKTRYILLFFDPANGVRVSETVLPIISVGGIAPRSLSPNCDRIAFVTTNGGKSIYPAWIERHIPALSGAHFPYRLALWVCGLDGNGLHELGCIVENERPYESFKIENLKWLPDGKSLSFVLDGRLRVTPAN